MPDHNQPFVASAAQRARAAAEYAQSPWAIRPEWLPVIADALRGPMSAEEVQERVGPQAAARGTRRSGSIAVISLRGVITPRGSWLSMLFGGGPSGLMAFQQAFGEALVDQDVAAILIDIDSPGGLVDLVPETAAMIRSARGEKPIVAIANTMAASAAYYLAAQADELVITPSGQVGSIGVLVVHDDWSKFNADFGVLPTYISAGRYKADGNPDEPLSDTAREAFQTTVDELYDMFVADVAAGRGSTPKAVRDGYGEGRCVLAKQALALGMVDRIETLDAVISRLVSSPSSGRSVAVAPPGAAAHASPEPGAVAALGAARRLAADLTFI